MWKILSIEAPDGELITQAKYFASVSEGSLTVETEGNWFFQEPTIKVPFAQVTEEMIVEWVKAETTRDGKNMVEERLNEQLEALKAQHKTPLPWLPQVFTPEI